MAKILVIDDEALLRNEVIEWLTFEGYETVGAKDGMEGITHAINHPPDLIVCDITMPRLDGYGVLLEVHANPETVGIPFIFMTARASHEDIRRGMDLGADDYLTKPFSRMEFLKAVQTRLDKKSLHEEKQRDEVQQLEQALDYEREQRLLRAKLVAMVSHDFRNPLSSIMSSCSLLRDYADRLDEKRRVLHFNRIEGSVRQLVQMLDDMMMVAQMETDHLDFAPAAFEIEPFLRRIVEDIQSIYTESHQLHFSSTYHEAVLLDSNLIRRMATNLIANAVKYSSKGSKVWVSLDKQSEQIILKVQDQGIGIPEADLARLFEAFQRGSNVAGIKGTGLGLAIVKEAVNLHQGSIQIESEVDQGTIFTVTLPIKVPEK